MSQPTPQQAYYRRLRTLEGTRPGFFQLGVRGWLGTLGVALFAILLGGGIMQVDGYASVGWIVVGLGLGSLARDVGFRRQYLHTWPLLDAVIDWGAVREQCGLEEDP